MFLVETIETKSIHCHNITYKVTGIQNERVGELSWGALNGIKQIPTKQLKDDQLSIAHMRRPSIQKHFSSVHSMEEEFVVSSIHVIVAKGFIMDVGIPPIFQLLLQAMRAYSMSPGQMVWWSLLERIFIYF
jgi:hypothetical protein